MSIVVIAAFERKKEEILRFGSSNRLLGIFKSLLSGEGIYSINLLHSNLRTVLLQTLTRVGALPAHIPEFTNARIWTFPF
jgi:hypothetical protein